MVQKTKNICAVVGEGGQRGMAKPGQANRKANVTQISTTKGNRKASQHVEFSGRWVTPTSTLRLLHVV